METGITTTEITTTTTTFVFHNCTEVSAGSVQAAQVDVYSAGFIIPCVLLAALNVLVIFGNSLVIAAVFTSHKLRTPTHTFIVSLALADLFVGVLVLPFSNANEVLKYWIFGHIWCSVWLAVDVWLCTASILNLCAISLDRYLAISRPFKYHDLMSPKRSKILVALVWVISFLICFPPLIGWNERGAPPGKESIGHRNIGDSVVGSGSDPGSGVTLDDSDYESRIYVVQLPVDNYSRVAYQPFNDTGSGMDEGFQEHECAKQYQQCSLTSEPSYIIYSALGSFYIPMCIMAFFYWKIYRAAVMTNEAIKRGAIVTKTGSEINSSTEQKSVTLRVHRGGSANSKSYSTTTLYNSRSSFREPSFSTIIESELTSTNGITRSTSGTGLNHFNRTKHKNMKNDNWRTQSARVRLEHTDIPASSPLLGKKRKKSKQQTPPPIRNKINRFKSADSMRESVILEDPSSVMSTTSMSDTVVDNNRQTTLLKKLGKHNFKNHIRKINKEKKAAKTVGIIVGCFILCWFPFFTCYLIGAFCDDCTPPLVFSIFFWLGYCNSAINPCVYALFSKDFRYAFKKLLSCKCEKTTFRGRSRPLSMLLSFKLQSSSRGSDSNSE